MQGDSGADVAPAVEVKALVDVVLFKTVLLFDVCDDALVVD